MNDSLPGKMLMLDFGDGEEAHCCIAAGPGWVTIVDPQNIGAWETVYLGEDCDICAVYPNEELFRQVALLWSHLTDPLARFIVETLRKLFVPRIVYTGVLFDAIGPDNFPDQFILLAMRHAGGLDCTGGEMLVANTDPSKGGTTQWVKIADYAIVDPRPGRQALAELNRLFGHRNGQLGYYLKQMQ